MAVVYANVRTNIYTAVFNHLQSDGTYAITSNNIHPNFNSEQVITEGYPQVIVKEPTTATQRVAVGPTSPLRRVPFTVEIEIYHNSSANVKSVADEVGNAIIAGNGALRADGLYDLKFQDDTIEDDEYQENRSVYTATLTLMGTYMVKV